MDYYENNAKAFVESTLLVDMQPLYQRFVPLLPERAKILDAGCGSGRDAKYFIERGYQVTAIDASAEIAALAKKEIGRAVQVQRLQDIRYKNQFDGIWACASLLHVPAKELPDVFRRLARALKSDGVIYCSFKYGQGEYKKQGRRFTDLDEDGLRVLVEEIGELAIQELWVTFSRAGIRAAAVHAESELPRNAALRQLESGLLEVIFSVDLFNEGTDLPAVDTLMMLRPTESKILFLQQLGRGLRLHPGKDHVQVLDFIGNHKAFLNKPESLFEVCSLHEFVRRQKSGDGDYYLQANNRDYAIFDATDGMGAFARLRGVIAPEDVAEG